MLTLILVTPWVAYINSVVLWLGRGTPPILFMVAFVSFPAFTFATVAGLRSADPAARELLASVEASRWEVLWRLRLPSALPSLFTAARFNVGLGLAAAYFTEGGALSPDGLGWVGVAGDQLQQRQPAVGGDPVHRGARRARAHAGDAARADPARLARVAALTASCRIARTLDVHDRGVPSRSRSDRSCAGRSN